MVRLLVYLPSDSKTSLIVYRGCILSRPLHDISMFCWSYLILELGVTVHVKVTIVPARSRLSREISTTGGSATDREEQKIYLIHAVSHYQ